MTQDYGQGATPRGYGQPWDRRGDSPRRGDVPAQRTPYDQSGSRPPAPGNGYGHGQPARVYGHQAPAPRQQQPERPLPDPRDGYPIPRQHAPEPEPRRRSRKPLALVMSFVLIGAGGGWYFLKGPGAAKAPTEQELRIADRQADPKPLTEAELFPSGKVGGSEASYTVLKTQAAADCATAAAGTVVDHLAEAGCNQVVRATLQTTDKVLVITAGAFNLESQEKAEKAASEIKKAIDEEKGRFGGLVAGGPSDIIARASASLTWDVRGHYLVYCVIAHADGSAVPEDDPRAQAIRTDVVEKHIESVVIQKRQTGAAPPS